MRHVNYISTDKQSAISGYGTEYIVGETVRHDDRSAGQATILSFEVDEAYNEVKVNTDKGYAHLDFVFKLEGSVD